MLLQWTVQKNAPPLSSAFYSKMIFKKKHKKDWHNPNPEFVGEIISVMEGDSGRKKAVIVRYHLGNFYMYGYLIDDSDFIAGIDDTVGWVFCCSQMISMSRFLPAVVSVRYVAMAISELRTGFGFCPASPDWENHVGLS